MQIFFGANQTGLTRQFSVFLQRVPAPLSSPAMTGSATFAGPQHPWQTPRDEKEGHP
jgi:hypothetical protein